jgi:hypothetical protein
LYKNLKNPLSSGAIRSPLFRRLFKIGAIKKDDGVLLFLLKRIKLVFKQVLRFFLKLKFIFKDLLKRRFRARLVVLHLVVGGMKHRGARMGKGVGKNKIVF